MDFTITAIPTTTADALRAEIAAGRLPARRVVLDEAGAPCRHCLQPGQVGDEMHLFTYQPFAERSPYTVASPIFLHADACARHDPATFPPLVRTGLRAVRAYDADDLLVDCDIAPGTGVEALIERLLADDRAEYLHVHSAREGCFTCRVDRVSA